MLRIRWGRYVCDLRWYGMLIGYVGRAVDYIGITSLEYHKKKSELNDLFTI